MKLSDSLKEYLLNRLGFVSNFTPEDQSITKDQVVGCLRRNGVLVESVPVYQIEKLQDLILSIMVTNFDLIDEIAGLINTLGNKYPIVKESYFGNHNI